MLKFIVGLIVGGLLFGAESAAQYGFGISLLLLIFIAKLYFELNNTPKQQPQRATFGGIFNRLAEERFAAELSGATVPRTGQPPTPMTNTRGISCPTDRT